MELKDLIGEHVLDAVDESFDSVRERFGRVFDDAQCIRFRLDGVVYVAVEDPDDGYRSCMREIAVGDGPMKNEFAPCRVLCRHRTEGDYGRDDDVLEMIDTTTGKTVLEVGTESVNDYYPSFVASFRPENMAANAVPQS